MRALLRAMHLWATRGMPPPPSRYPRLDAGTLVTLLQLKFPSLLGVSDPRGVEGPGDMVAGVFVPLPFLVPQVDADGNELAGVRVPEVAVPLATTTGWNFRSGRVGNPTTVYALLGSYMPFARTRLEREGRGDPRRAIDERYPDRTEYLRRIHDAASALVKDRFLLAEDVENVGERAARHWDHVRRTSGTQTH